MRRYGTLVLGFLAAALCVAITPDAAEAEASLRGSRAGMIQQNSVAMQHGLTFHRTSAEIRWSVVNGTLVRLEGNEDYEVASFVGHPYLVPEALLFVERIAAQYREACGEKLIVTSATRPSNRQPRNAHSLSVHPAGMAVDLRVSQRQACRAWLEAALLGMESRGLINGIREFRPPHYHVAVFPGRYGEYAAKQIAIEEEERARRMEAMARAIRTAEVSGFLTPEDSRATTDLPDLPELTVWPYTVPAFRIVAFALYALGQRMLG